ncbi:MAG TPA: hypothetical protein VHY18_06535 [Solirubrobacteraceae bacterium]|nr:hypothetical protein [Solirubrobacteraceae bacterium]
MRSPAHKRLVRLTAILAVIGIGEWSVLLAHASQTPAWVHLLCSPSALHSSVLHAGPGLNGLLTRVLNTLLILLPHWPHILPILLALWTLVYLWRANTRYRAGEGSAHAQS